MAASIDGSSVLATTNFNTSYSNSFSAGSSYMGHTAQVVVYAWDDPTGLPRLDQDVQPERQRVQAADSVTDSDQDADADADSDADPHAYAHPHSYPDAHADAHTDADADSDAVRSRLQGETATPEITPTPDPCATVHRSPPIDELVALEDSAPTIAPQSARPPSSRSRARHRVPMTPLRPPAPRTIPAAAPLLPSPCCWPRSSEPSAWRPPRRSVVTPSAARRHLGRASGLLPFDVRAGGSARIRRPLRVYESASAVLPAPVHRRNAIPPYGLPQQN